MVVIISHDAIPHHHMESDNDITISYCLFDKSYNGKTSKDHNQKKPFPQHQHFFSNPDFIVTRTTITLNKVIKDNFPDSIPLSLDSSDFKGNISDNGFHHIINNTLSSYLFIISCNVTRGSPHIA